MAMFFVAGVILLVVGLAGILLEFTGMGKSIPGFTSIPLDIMGFAVLFGIGVVVAMMSRRPGD